MAEARKIWFSIREPTVCHLFSECDYVGRIYDENEAAAFVKIGANGLPLDLPPMATVCTVCSSRVATYKAFFNWPGWSWHLTKKRH